MLNKAQVIAVLKDRKKYCTEILKTWRGIAYGISVHTKGACPSYKIGTRTIKPVGYMGKEYQDLFDDYLFARHPREAEETRQWRYSQYRPFQKDPLLRIISVIAGAGFQDSNYTIEMSNRKDNEYIWGNNFEGCDIVRYFEKHIKSILEDPNAFFIRIPKEPWNNTTTNEIEPDIWFINSKDMILTPTKEEVLFEKNGYVWHVTTSSIFRYREKKTQGSGETTWELADDQGYYEHGFGYLPIDTAGGNWNTEGYFESWIVSAKALCDEIVAAKSAEQLVDKEASHPWIIQAETVCDFCDGQKTTQIECEASEAHPEGYKLGKCTACRGTGQKQSQNPGDRLIVPADLMKGNDLLKVVTPPIEVNKNHREKCAELMLALLDALNLLKVLEAQSGVAKALDMDALHQFLSKFFNDLFDRIIYNSCRDTSAYRNITVVNGVNRPAIQPYTIIKPTQFHIKTASLLLGEYEAGVTAGLPLFARAASFLAFVDKQYSGDKVMVKKSQVIVNIDYLSVATQEEKAAMALTGEATAEALQFSIRLPLILDKIIAEKSVDWFLKTDIKTIGDLALTAFKILVPEPIQITPLDKKKKTAETT